MRGVKSALKKGDIYLKSVSYYTPAALSQRLVKASVDHAIASAPQDAGGKTFMDLKILDNACGSGHFLVEALGYLTDLALARLEHDTDLQQLVAGERSKITEQLDFRRELDMTNDKYLFIEKSAPDLLPPFEGKMIWQYSHAFEMPQYWLDAQAFDKRLQSKELFRMAQDLGVPKAEVAQHAGAVCYDREFVRLAFREIARDTDERSLIFALLPKNSGYGHTLFADTAKTYFMNSVGEVNVKAVSPLRLLFALAWFNSLPVDWLARFMIQIHISKTYLYRLPMPQPTDAEILANPDYAQLAKNALLLSLAASWEDFAELAPLFNVQPKDLPQAAKAQDTLRAQNDKLVARLYGITNAELAHLLRSFKVMANKRSEYLTLLH